MTSTFAHECEPDRKATTNVVLIFAAVYCVIILLVYFAQTTSVWLGRLNEQAIQIIDYSKSGLYFKDDLLGYGLMALSTFFIGLTISGNTKVVKWFGWLLILHGAFFIPCLICPCLAFFK